MRRIQGASVVGAAWRVVAAVLVLGQGAVRADEVARLEPVEDTVSGIAELKLGISLTGTPAAPGDGSGAPPGAEPSLTPCPKRTVYLGAWESAGPRRMIPSTTVTFGSTGTASSTVCIDGDGGTAAATVKVLEVEAMKKVFITASPRAPAAPKPGAAPGPGETATSILTLFPVTIDRVTCRPDSLALGKSGTFRVQLSGVSASERTVSVSALDPAITKILASVTIPAGRLSAEVPFTAGVAREETTSYLKAEDERGSKVCSLRILKSP